MVVFFFSNSPQSLLRKTQLRRSMGPLQLTVAWNTKRTMGHPKQRSRFVLDALAMSPLAHLPLFYKISTNQRDQCDDPSSIFSFQFSPHNGISVCQLSVICELSLLLVLVLFPRGFSWGTLVFPTPQNQHFQIQILSMLFKCI